MDERIQHISKPRCFLVHALAPSTVPAREANRVFNEFIADPSLPLPVFHDHFIGRPGGIAVFFVDSPSGRDSLLNNSHLNGWEVDIRPLIFSYSPSAFDEQIAFTLRAYRGLAWATVRREERPSYGNSAREAETAQEDGNLG
jgi:hypothetical protein